jgi:hypothetical protein
VGGAVRPQTLPGGPPAGSTVDAMRLRLGRARLLGGLVGAWQQAKGGDAWWAAGRRAGQGRSASSPDRGSTRPADAPAGRSPTTPFRAPRRPATGAAGRAASTAGRSTATATCSTWSTAPGRWWRSWIGCGGSGGRASAAVRGQECGHGVDGWQACRGEQLGWRHAVMDLLPGPAGPTPLATGGPDPLREVIWFGPTLTGGPASSPPVWPCAAGSP